MYGPCLATSVAGVDCVQVPIFLTKAIELYEMICVRHGLMVVGPTGGGKSKNIAVLKEALTHLKVYSIRAGFSVHSQVNTIQTLTTHRCAMVATRRLLNHPATNAGVNHEANDTLAASTCLMKIT